MKVFILIYKNNYILGVYKSKQKALDKLNYELDNNKLYNDDSRLNFIVNESYLED